VGVLVLHRKFTIGLVASTFVGLTYMTIYALRTFLFAMIERCSTHLQNLIVLLLGCKLRFCWQLVVTANFNQYSFLRLGGGLFYVDHGLGAEMSTRFLLLLLSSDLDTCHID